MHRHLHEEEAVAALIDRASRGTPLIDVSTGQVYAPDAALQRAQKHKANAQALETHMDSVGKKAALWFRWRDRFLMLGLLLLAAGRVISMWPR